MTNQNIDLLNIHLIPLARLKPHPENPRRIGKKSIENLRQSLLTNGWTQTIIASLRDNGEYVVLAGHTRRLAALEIHRLGESIPNMPDTALAPVHVREGMTEAEEKALVISDNIKHSQWNKEQRENLVAELSKLTGAASLHIGISLPKLPTGLTTPNITEMLGGTENKEFLLIRADPRTIQRIADQMSLTKEEFWRW